MTLGVHAMVVKNGSDQTPTFRNSRHSDDPESSRSVSSGRKRPDTGLFATAATAVMPVQTRFVGLTF